MRSRVAVATLATLALSTCSPPSWGGDRSRDLDELVIVSDLPLSGAAGDDARAVGDAIALAIRNRGTVAGYRLTYLPVDDSLIGVFSSDKAEQNVRLMISDARVMALIGPWNSEVAQLIIPIGNQAGLVIVSPSNTADCLTDPADPCTRKPTILNNYFRVAARDSEQASAAARFAVEKLGVSQFAVLDDGSEYGATLADAFAQALIGNGGDAVMRRAFAAITSDYRPLLDEARRAGAQAIYVGGSAITGACRIRADMVEVFPADAYMLGDDGLSGRTCVDDAGRGADEHLLMTVSDSQPPRDSKVYRDFQAHQIEPVSYAFAAYDCALIVIAAIERAIRAAGGRVPTRTQVRAEVAATRDFVGASGTFTFNANGDVANGPVSVYRVERGKWTFWQTAK